MRLTIHGHPMACVLALTIALGFWTTAALAQEAVPQVTSTYSGASLYRTYCQSCYGESGKGDGSFASALRKQPADLTQIATRNDGEFPEAMVAQIIDGRDPVAGHGAGDMPVWGDAFLLSRVEGTEEAVKARIDALVRYIRTLQARP